MILEKSTLLALVTNLFIFLFTLLLPTSVLSASHENRHLNYSKLRIERNSGQTIKPFTHLARFRDLEIFFSPAEILFSLPSFNINQTPTSNPLAPDSFRMTFDNGQPADVVAIRPLKSVTNYFIGNDSSKWLSNIVNYSEISYLSIYPGIDLKFYSDNRHIEYDIIVHPGSDPNEIALHFHDAEDLQIDSNGNLLFSVGPHNLVSRAPNTFQKLPTGGLLSVDARYKLVSNDIVGFVIDSYDTTSDLIIDPVIEYSGFLGGSAPDRATGIAVDRDGAILVVGSTDSENFPNKGNNLHEPFSADEMISVHHAFVTKLNPNGDDIAFSTFIGGTMDSQSAQDVALDSNGNVFVVGSTHADDFPLVNPVDSSRENEEGFLLKISSDGSNLLYSTFLGGSEGDAAMAVAVDPLGDAYVVGGTDSADLGATPGAFDTTFNGGVGNWPSDLFVAKLEESTDALALEYLTFLGGSNMDIFGSGNSIAVDRTGHAYVVGATRSLDFLSDAPESTLNGALVGESDGFIVKLNSDGSGVDYWTFLGGTGSDIANGVTVDLFDNAYIAGRTSSENFPITTGAFQTTKAGGRDAFVAKLNAHGNHLDFSTYHGGTENDGAIAIALDVARNPYVVGNTRSTDFPVSDSLTSIGSEEDLFVTKFDNDGMGIVYSTLLGGSVQNISSPFDDIRPPSEQERGNGIAVDIRGAAYVVGETDAVDFPIMSLGGLLPAHQGDTDAFVTKIAPFPATTENFEYDAKVICGIQREPNMRHVLSVGSYATSVNIFNPTLEPVTMRKTLSLAHIPASWAPPGVPAETPGPTVLVDEAILGPRRSFMADCNELLGLFGGHNAPFQLFEGFLSIRSSDRLRVTAVYTVNARDSDVAASSVPSIEIDEVRGIDSRLDGNISVNSSVPRIIATECSPPFGTGFPVIKLEYLTKITNLGSTPVESIHIEERFSMGNHVLADVLETTYVISHGGVFTKLNDEIDTPAEPILYDISISRLGARESATINRFVNVFLVAPAEAYEVGALPGFVRNTVTGTAASDTVNTHDNIAVRIFNPIGICLP